MPTKHKGTIFVNFSGIIGENTPVFGDRSVENIATGVVGLFARAENVIGNATELLPDCVTFKGALMIYCAGCMLAVGVEVDTKLEIVRVRNVGLPLIAGFTFGGTGIVYG